MIAPPADFRRAARFLPILCVDVVVEGPDGRFLLVKRRREPMKGRWWVVGGRVFRGERLSAAAVRKVREETGLPAAVTGPLGYYEDLSEKTPWGGRFRRHSVSVVFRAFVRDAADVRLDAQSADWKWSRTLPGRFRIVPLDGRPGGGAVGRR